MLWVQCEEVTTHKNLDGKNGVKTEREENEREEKQRMRCRE